MNEQVIKEAFTPKDKNALIIRVKRNRKVIKLTSSSYCVTIPPEWLQIIEKDLGRRLEFVNLLFGDVIVIAPSERTPESLKLLEVWCNFDTKIKRDQALRALKRLYKLNSKKKEELK